MNEEHLARSFTHMIKIMGQDWNLMEGHM